MKKVLPLMMLTLVTLLSGSVQAQFRSCKTDLPVTDAPCGTIKRMNLATAADTIQNKTDTIFGCVRDKVMYTLSGSVFGKQGTPIPYASVIVSGTGFGTSADSMGNYSINIPATFQQKLEFSSVGYRMKIVDVSGLDQSHRNVVLEDRDTMYSSVILVTQTRRHIRCGLGCRYIICRRHVITTDSVPEKISISIFPNPAAKAASVTIKMNMAGTYTMQVADNHSRIIQQHSFAATAKNETHQLRLPSTIAAGIYYVIITDIQSKKQFTEKLIIL